MRDDIDVVVFGALLGLEWLVFTFVLIYRVLQLN